MTSDIYSDSGDKGYCLCFSIGSARLEPLLKRVQKIVTGPRSNRVQSPEEKEEIRGGVVPCHVEPLQKHAVEKGH